MQEKRNLGGLIVPAPMLLGWEYPAGGTGSCSLPCPWAVFDKMKSIHIIRKTMWSPTYRRKESQCRAGTRLAEKEHTSELLGDETITAIAQAHGVISAWVILRWNLQKNVVVISGSRNPEHIRENLDRYGFVLTEEVFQIINLWYDLGSSAIL